MGINFKKHFCIYAAAFLVAFHTASTNSFIYTENVYAAEAASTVTSGTVYQVTASSLNVRSGAGTGYTKLGTLSNGAKVTVLSVSSNNWGKINYNGKTGWISLSYCKKLSSGTASTQTTSETSSQSSQTTSESTASGTLYKVTASSLYVRSGAGTGYTVLGTLANGTQVTVLSVSSNNWGKINYKGSTGWISLTYCQKLSSGSSSTEKESGKTSETTQPASQSTQTTSQSTQTTSESAQSTTESASAGSLYKVTASSLYVRSGPGTSYSVLGTLANGTQVTVLSVSNSKWGQINYKGTTGWISLTYCQKLSSGSSSAGQESEEASGSTQTTSESTQTTSESTQTTSESTQTTSEATESASESSKSHALYQVTASSLYVRSGPGTSYSVLGTLSKGTQVTVFSIVDSKWGQIDYKGDTGWISLTYCAKLSGTVTDAGQTSQTGGTTISWNSSWTYASYSKCHDSSVTLYRSQASNRNGIVVALNAGHGSSAATAVKTYCHPDGSAKVTGGSTASGSTTAVGANDGTILSDGTTEASANLSAALIIKEALLEKGYDVLMIRETEDCCLDNIARTVYANNNADCHLSIHYDSTDTDKGFFCINVPDNATYRSMEPVASHYEEHNALCSALVQGAQQTGVKIYENGLMPMDLTQTSYSTVPSADVEIGDRATSHSADYHKQVAEAICDGLDIYFGINR